MGEATKDQKKVEARLSLDHLSKLAEVTGIPLVLHGGSGIRQEDMRASMKTGIAKVNVGTEIRQAYEKVTKAGGSVPDAQEAVYQRTVSLIKDWFGLGGIAHDFRVVLHERPQRAVALVALPVGGLPPRVRFEPVSQADHRAHPFLQGGEPPDARHPQ